MNYIPVRHRFLELNSRTRPRPLPTRFNGLPSVRRFAGGAPSAKVERV
jgi:hypothetical protein